METNWDALWTFSQGTEKYLESQKGYQQSRQLLLACVTRRVRNDSALLRTETELESILVYRWVGYHNRIWKS
jgi:hypothetical protein